MSNDDISGSRVRVKCGQSLSTPPPPPPPPTTPPPKPTHLCKIAILGNANVGKSSLVQKFIYRRYANTTTSGETDLLNVNNTNGESSTTTFNSLGTSNTFGGSSALTTEPTLADYYKKDVTIWYNDNDQNDIQIPQDQEKKSTVCIRVQCWDMNIQRQQQYDQQQINDDLTTTDNDVQSVQSSTITASPRNANINASLLPLLKRINGLIIVCKCPLPPSNNVSSNASYVSYASKLSCKDDSDWMELDLLEQEMQQWIAFMKDHQEEEGTNDDKQLNRPLIYVVLSCADLAVVGYSPREWMQLSMRMQEICHSYGISSWKISTSMDTTSSSDDNNGEQQPHLRQSKILQRMMNQQKQILEDMEDGIEASFIELISMYLQQQQSRKVNIKS